MQAKADKNFTIMQEKIDTLLAEVNKLKVEKDPETPKRDAAKVNPYHS